MTPPGPTQLLVVLLVVVLLFGAKKLPDLARSVGRSTRILRSELSETREDGAARSEDRALEERPAGEPAARERVAEERTTGER
ncbi:MULTISPECIES: twin-arginine translocase TatA/TatE family subunit [Pseudonocardia]|uniref:twin-arginine translocase TatA/TatE family subunit n=1 Tax=Pseudonocardia TaxID=1847 RepID=UPI001AD6506D|nr:MULTISPECIES: twin-arginine translocase TatA/TatE family subunit [Pseudonocardia]MBO4240097.1 twin-arginine translocase TatA/TatE family subunit [Pseudonocardia alni]